MRKAFITLTTLFSFSLCAQNITWQNVNLNVPFENTQAVFNLIDGFYSNIEIPDVTAAIESNKKNKNANIYPPTKFDNNGGST